MHFLTLLVLLASTTRAAIDPENFQRALSQIQDLARQAVNSSNVHVPGLSIAVVYNGSVQYTGGFGVREIGSNDSVSADTVFRLASMSKPVSSTIVAAMVSASNLTWTSKTNVPNNVAQYSDPWISAELTIADGFSHRSGLYPLAGDELEIAGFDEQTILSHLRYMVPYAPFRASYGYSNYGITAAAVSAAKHLNLTWPNAASQYLYSPLSMTSTTSSYTTFLTRPNRVALHIPSSGMYFTNTTSWLAGPERNPDPEAPAGGVTSSANDLAKWLQLQLAIGINPETGEQLISQAALNETRLAHIVRGTSPESGAPAYYGLGWNIDYDVTSGRVYHSHAGAFSQGTRTQVKMCVEDGIGIVVLANCFPTGWPDGIADYFLDVVYNGKNGTDWIDFWNGLYDELSAAGTAGAGAYSGTPEVQSDMLGVESYVGWYENDWVGRVRIEATAGGGGVDNGTGNGTIGGQGELVMTIPDNSNLSFPLKHWSRDTFAFVQEPDQGTGVFFTIGADGNATAVTVEYYDGNGGGKLMRVET